MSQHSEDGLERIRRAQTLSNEERAELGWKPKGGPKRLRRILQQPDADDFDSTNAVNTLDPKPLTMRQRERLGYHPPNNQPGPRVIGKPYIAKREAEKLNDVQRIALGLKPKSVDSLLRIYAEGARPPEEPRTVEGLTDLSTRDFVTLRDRAELKIPVETRLRRQLSDIFERYQRLWLNKREW